MSLVTNSDFGTIRDSLISSFNALGHDPSQVEVNVAWAAATAAFAGKDADWQSNLAGLKGDILKAAVRATFKIPGLSTPEVHRVGDAYAVRIAAGDLAAAAWTAAKALFPHYEDAALEGHKTEALAWAADHPLGYPAA